MATGIASAEADDAIDAVVAKGTWIQLHTGDPGGAGTSNVATETGREEASFAAASGGTAVTDAPLSWTDLAGPTPPSSPEDITHFSMWTANAAGSFLWSGTVTANPIFDGDTLTFPAGDLELSITGAS